MLGVGIVTHEDDRMVEILSDLAQTVCHAYRVCSSITSRCSTAPPLFLPSHQVWSAALCNCVCCHRVASLHWHNGLNIILPMYNRKQCSMCTGPDTPCSVSCAVARLPVQFDTLQPALSTGVKLAAEGRTECQRLHVLPQRTCGKGPPS